MADFDAPPGPPPPKVPEGWIVKWNDQYKEWFYVNSYTRKSQWEKPTAPAPRPDDHDGPEGPPPSYTPGKNPTAASDTKSAAGTTNPFETSKTGGSSSASQQEEEDARLARQMQEEENARAHSPQPGSGAAASYASTPVPGSASPYGSDPQLPPRPDDGRGGGSRGLLGKLFGGKNKMSSQQQQGYGGGYPGQQPYGGGGYGSPQPQYGAYPPQGYGGPGYGGYGPGPGYGGPPPGGYYGGGGYPQQQQQARPSRMGGGMGMAGGAALGLGAGLVGGMLLEDAIDHHDQQIYNEGYENGDMGDGGGDYGGDGGGDLGGGDF